MTCRTALDLLAEAALAAPGSELPAGLAEHLEHCPACAAELAAPRATVAALDAARPVVAAQADVWARLVPALDAVDAARARRRAWLPFAVPPLRLAAKAATVLLAAAGALIATRERPTAPPVATAAAAAAPLDTRLAEYLQRSTPLLVALANRDEAASAAAFDAVAERRLARELAGDGRALAAELRDARRARDTQLVGEIVVLCMQIGNTPGNRYRASVALAREGIERRDLLFALSVQELRRSGATV
jgi:hypothetical protein